MAERRECVVAWCDGEPFAIVDEQLEDEDGPDPADVRMVELRDGERVLTADENAAVLRLLVALKAWRHDGYQTGHWPHLCPIAHALESLPAKLLAAAKETKP